MLTKLTSSCRSSIGELCSVCSAPGTASIPQIGAKGHRHNVQSEEQKEGEKRGRGVFAGSGLWGPGLLFPLCLPSPGLSGPGGCGRIPSRASSRALGLCPTAKSSMARPRGKLLSHHSSDAAVVLSAGTRGSPGTWGRTAAHRVQARRNTRAGCCVPPLAPGWG